MAHIIGSLQGLLHWLIHAGPIYIVALSILVFVHEFGHFWVARRCGVKIEAFSIGFGGELFGWTDRLGTRWRVAWLPIGGFVKMFGDADASSRPDTAAAAQMDAEARRVSFTHKKLWQKALIVAAGPAANFLFAIVIMAVLFSTIGQPFTPPVIGSVVPGSAAEKAGLMAGDVVESVDGVTVRRFEELRQMVVLGTGDPLTLTLMRKGQAMTLVATPQIVEEDDLLGNKTKVGRLGMMPSGQFVMRHEDPATALWQATRETWSITASSLTAIGQMITGRRSSDDLRGPIGMSQVIEQVSHEGFIPLVQLVALLSISLGLINLFPIPVLDGGHLLFYAIEAVSRRPVSDRALAVGFRVGFALIVSFYVFVMWNDITKHI
ncbi:MAG: rseP [Rhodospirillales bacterium]|nr:rseP [Rhodospirillales bacterium]